MSVNSFTKHEPLIFKTGSNIKLIHRAEYCKSIIADGKELITGNESGEIRVPELNDEKVYITFKEDVTDLSNAFLRCYALISVPENLFANNQKVTNFSFTFALCKSLKSIPTGLFAHNKEVTDFSVTFFDCSSLTSIPEKLFANCPKVTDFYAIFEYCTSLTSIPSSLFDNNRKVKDLTYAFDGCSALTGESPYTMIGDKKVHLYERADYPKHFTTPTDFWKCFYDCTGLTDYNQIPSDWKL